MTIPGTGPAPNPPQPTGPPKTEPPTPAIEDDWIAKNNALLELNRTTARNALIWHTTAIALAKIHVGEGGDHNALINSVYAIAEKQFAQ